jgi:hypothetical protein
MQIGKAAILVLLHAGLQQIFAEPIVSRHDATCPNGKAHYCYVGPFPHNGKKIIGGMCT